MCLAFGSGVLDWQGQLLLKGKDDAAPVKLVAAKDAPAEAPTAEAAKEEVEIS